MQIMSKYNKSIECIKNYTRGYLMWSKFSKKIVIKEEVKWSDVDFSYSDIIGSIRSFTLTLSERIEEPSSDYKCDDESIFCSYNKDFEPTGWFKIFKELKYTVDIKKESYKTVARKIANDVAKENRLQLYYSISSTIKNQHGEHPIIIKNKLTKKYTA